MWVWTPWQQSEACPTYPSLLSPRQILILLLQFLFSCNIPSSFHLSLYLILFLFYSSQEPPGIFYLLKITGNFQRCLSGSCSGSLRYILSESSECSLCLYLQSFSRPRGISHLSLTSGNAVQTRCLSQREVTLSLCLVPLCDVPRPSPRWQLCELTCPFPAASPYTRCLGLWYLEPMEHKKSYSSLEVLIPDLSASIPLTLVEILDPTEEQTLVTL